MLTNQSQLYLLQSCPCSKASNNIWEAAATMVNPVCIVMPNINSARISLLSKYAISAAFVRLQKLSQQFSQKRRGVYLEGSRNVDAFGRIHASQHP